MGREIQKKRIMITIPVPNVCICKCNKDKRSKVNMVHPLPDACAYCGKYILDVEDIARFKEVHSRRSLMN
jgi:hypothetical protein